MITSFNALCIRSNNYDLCETGSENPSETALWIREKTAECEAKAKAFFATKVRKKAYVFSGEVPENCPKSFLCCLTDEEVARVKVLTVEHYNDYVKIHLPNWDETDLVSSFEQLCKEDLLAEIYGENQELDDLIFDRYNRLDGPFILHSIDLQNVYCLYSMTYQEFGKEPIKIKASLTDEEYIYLLTQRLLNDSFSFNRLLLYRPELAQKINEQLDGCCNDFLFESENPFLIVFDEVNADAEAIQKED